MNAIFFSIPLISLAGFLSSAAAEDFHRAGMSEIGGIFQGTFGETVDGSINGTRGNLKLDDLFAGGINFGYNITDHLNVNTDMLFTDVDLRFSGGGFSLHDDAPAILWTVNLDYYILPTRFTPYLSAGVGLVSMYNEYD